MKLPLAIEHAILEFLPFECLGAAALLSKDMHERLKNFFKSAVSLLVQLPPPACEGGGAAANLLQLCCSLRRLRYFSHQRSARAQRLLASVIWNNSATLVTLDRIFDQGPLMTSPGLAALGTCPKLKNFEIYGGFALMDAWHLCAKHVFECVSHPKLLTYITNSYNGRDALLSLD